MSSSIIYYVKYTHVHQYFTLALSLEITQACGGQYLLEHLYLNLVEDQVH